MPLSAHRLRPAVASFSSAPASARASASTAEAGESPGRQDSARGLEPRKLAVSIFDQRVREGLYDHLLGGGIVMEGPSLLLNFHMRESTHLRAVSLARGSFANRLSLPKHLESPYCVNEKKTFYDTLFGCAGEEYDLEYGRYDCWVWSSSTYYYKRTNQALVDWMRAGIDEPVRGILNVVGFDWKFLSLSARGGRVAVGVMADNQVLVGNDFEGLRWQWTATGDDDGRPAVAQRVVACVVRPAREGYTAITQDVALRLSTWQLSGTGEVRRTFGPSWPSGFGSIVEVPPVAAQMAARPLRLSPEGRHLLIMLPGPLDSAARGSRSEPMIVCFDAQNVDLPDPMPLRRSESERYSDSVFSDDCNVLCLEGHDGDQSFLRLHVLAANTSVGAPVSAQIKLGRVKTLRFAVNRSAAYVAALIQDALESSHTGRTALVVYHRGSDSSYRKVADIHLGTLAESYFRCPDLRFADDTADLILALNNNALVVHLDGKPLHQGEEGPQRLEIDGQKLYDGCVLG